MRNLFCLAIAATVLAMLPSSTTAQTTGAAAPDAGVGDPLLTPDELDRLVAPIALYPDVLIAQILPASTFPTDVVLAARWLRTKPDLAQLDAKSWDASVKALCHYPEVIEKLDQDLDWTNALGAAFLAQGEDVMKAIQAGREKARASGILQTTREQTVVIEEEAIRVVPTQADVVYVPQYSPQIIYVDDDHDDSDEIIAASAISFGAGLALGAWLDMDCGWHGYAVHYCQPGYWGGWGHWGAIAVGDDWVAGVGPRRAFAVGEDRGFYVGPRGGAAWGEHGGVAWRRPPGPAPRPVYTGRYASYGARGTYNRSGNFSNNQINVNRNNVNVDRGDRAYVPGGSRTNLGGDSRSPIGRDAGQAPARPSAGAPAQRPPNAPDRRPAAQPSAFDTGSPRPQTSQAGQRGQQSRDTMSGRPDTYRPSAPASPSPSYRSPSSSGSSAFGDSRGSSQVSRSSSRGSSSRSSGMSRGGGGGRSFGGRGGRR